MDKQNRTVNKPGSYVIANNHDRSVMCSLTYDYVVLQITEAILFAMLTVALLRMFQYKKPRNLKLWLPVFLSSFGTTKGFSKKFSSVERPPLDGAKGMDCLLII